MASLCRTRRGTECLRRIMPGRCSIGSAYPRSANKAAAPVSAARSPDPRQARRPPTVRRRPHRRAWPTASRTARTALRPRRRGPRQQGTRQQGAGQGRRSDSAPLRIQQSLRRSADRRRFQRCHRGPAEMQRRMARIRQRRSQGRQPRRIVPLQTARPVPWISTQILPQTAMRRHSRHPQPVMHRAEVIAAVDVATRGRRRLQGQPRPRLQHGHPRGPDTKPEPRRSARPR